MAYMMCECSEGVFSDEYVVIFQVIPSRHYNNSQGSCFVARNKVTLFDEKKGLVELTCAHHVSGMNDSLRVGIMDLQAHRVSHFYVPRDSVQEGISSMDGER